MCGVVGYSSENPIPEHYEFLYRIIDQSKIRGLHSFGFSYFNEGIKTIKRHDIKDIKFPVVNKLIYHNRYSTSGDFQEHNNNQPIVSGNASLVFNGVLDMRTKREMEASHGIKMQTENDGEIILKKCGTDARKISEYVSGITGSFAGLILTHENKIIAIRNKNRPLWRLQVDGAVYYASTRDIFIRAGSKIEPEILNPNVIYEN